MKVFLLTILVASIGVTAFAQTHRQAEKNALLILMAEISKTKTPESMARLYDVSKEYVAKFGSDTDEGTVSIKKFVSEYRIDLFYKAVEAKNTTDTFKLGNEIIAAEPDNTSVYLGMAFTAYNASTAGTKGFEKQMVDTSTAAIRMIGEGKVPTKWYPFGNQDDSLAWLHYFRAIANQESDPRATAFDMYKAASYKSAIRTKMDPYYYVAVYYEKVFEAISKDFNAKIAAGLNSGNVVASERARIDKCIDLMLDAYARAVKYSEAGKDVRLADLKERFEQIYKFRKGTDAGMAQFYAGIDLTTMPDPANFK